MYQDIADAFTKNSIKGFSDVRRNKIFLLKTKCQKVHKIPIWNQSPSEKPVIVPDLWSPRNLAHLLWKKTVQIKSRVNHGLTQPALVSPLIVLTWLFHALKGQDSTKSDEMFCQIIIDLCCVWTGSFRRGWARFGGDRRSVTINSAPLTHGLFFLHFWKHFTNKFCRDKMKPLKSFSWPLRIKSHSGLSWWPEHMYTHDLQDDQRLKWRIIGIKSVVRCWSRSRMQEAEQRPKQKRVLTAVITSVDRYEVEERPKTVVGGVIRSLLCHMCMSVDRSNRHFHL